MKEQRLTSSENLAELGLKLQKKRLKLNLTQKDISLKTGINRATLSQIENGKNFNVKYLIKLLIVFNLFQDFMKLLSVPEISPMDLYKLKKKERKRASKNKIDK